MSVIKWIHVNHGDSIVEPFFAKVKSLLAPNGIFILEPQPWSSYKKKKLSPDAKKIFDQIKIKPDQFPELIEKCGFKLKEMLDGGQEKEEKGQPGNFKDRQILVFQKI